MKITGIICEYNPLHLGHKKQLSHIRQLEPDGGIVCLMSGNFVQRGAPAIFNKAVRAKAVILSGADLVLELPVTAALSSAEGFASKGVSLLSSFCDDLCFGAETADTALLMKTAQALLSPGFSDALREQLSKGLSFPAARQAALEATGCCGSILTQPNNILAVEYCKAILAQNSAMQPLPIVRGGDYHDTRVNKEDPSATALRGLMATGQPWRDLVPPEAVDCFENAAVHSLQEGETAILYRLRTMADEEFEALPYGSEGLWRKLMHASRSETSLEAILEATKSKRYTRTRLNRMVMCAFLGITKEVLEAPVPYARILAFNGKGRQILKAAKEAGPLHNIGEVLDHPYQSLETRCGDLYGLFARDGSDGPGSEKKQRVFYLE